MTGEAVIRNEQGAILGADYRQNGALNKTGEPMVPGVVRADQVFSGDTIVMGEALLTVLGRTPGVTRSWIRTRTKAGAEVIWEWANDRPVIVVDVGAFEPKPVDPVVQALRDEVAWLRIVDDEEPNGTDMLIANALGRVADRLEGGL